jgi:hypothetical protein
MHDNFKEALALQKTVLVALHNNGSLRCSTDKVLLNKSATQQVAVHLEKLKSSPVVTSALVRKVLPIIFAAQLAASKHTLPRWLQTQQCL